MRSESGYSRGDTGTAYGLEWGDEFNEFGATSWEEQGYGDWPAEQGGTPGGTPRDTPRDTPADTPAETPRTQRSEESEEAAESPDGEAGFLEPILPKNGYDGNPITYSSRGAKKLITNLCSDCVVAPSGRCLTCSYPLTRHFAPDPKCTGLQVLPNGKCAVCGLDDHIHYMVMTDR